MFINNIFKKIYSYLYSSQKMVEKNEIDNGMSIAPTIGNSREARLWNTVDQIEKVLEELEKNKDKITELSLSTNSLSIEVSEAIAKKVMQMKNLRIAGFNDIFVSRLKTDSPVSLGHLIRAIEDKNIQILNLSDNAFGPIGVASFDFYLKKTNTLKELYLENNGLGPEGAELLANALRENKNIRLERIRVGRNRLENKGATAFGEFFKSTNSLIEVVCFQNGIKDEGMSKLLEGLGSNKSLEIIKVNDNFIGELSSATLVKILDNLTNLKVIDISDSKLGCENSVKVFEKLVKIESLEEIYSNYNEIEEKDSQNEIIDILLTMNHKLKKLELKGNEIKKSVFKKIKTNELLDNTDCYSESEMDEEELNDLMSGLKIDKQN